LITWKGEAQPAATATLGSEVHTSSAAIKGELMMTVRSRPSRVRALGLLALSASIVALTATTAPASAGLGVACPDPTSRAFQPWGDGANYAYAPNGGFESGTSGWAVSGGARVVAGNQTFFTHGPGERYSLSLPGGSSATSPAMCIGLLSSKMRFFVANAGSSSSRLKVQVIYNGGTSGLLSAVTKGLGVSDVGYVTAGGAWQPSPAIAMLSGNLPLLTQSVQFRFTPADRKGSWLIDDVYLDPLRHG
jgi:hypothetical protein